MSSNRPARLRNLTGHRIQDGKAIVSFILDYPDREDIHDFKKWIGDAYELRNQLNAVIDQLERNQRRRET